MKYTVSACLSILFALLPYSVIASCLVCPVDNANPNHVNGSTMPGTSLWGQQFLACQNGQIDSIEVWTSGGDIDLYLVSGDGSGINYGSPYQTFSGQPAGSTTLVLDQPYLVNECDLYAFALGSGTTAFSVFFDRSPVTGLTRVPSAPDGQFHFIYDDTASPKFTENNASDLIFKINISDTPLVPTLPQWALILYGLLILNLGVFSVSRFFTLSSQKLNKRSGRDV